VLALRMSRIAIAFLLILAASAFPIDAPYITRPVSRAKSSFIIRVRRASQSIGGLGDRPFADEDGVPALTF